MFDYWLVHGNYGTYYYLYSENDVQIKQNLWTMERKFLGQETFTVSQLHIYITNFLSRYLASFCLGQNYFLYLTAEQVNSEIKMLFIYLLLPCNTSFFPYLKHLSSILVFLKLTYDNILTQNGQMQENVLKYYKNQSQTNNVCNVVKMAPQARIYFQANHHRVLTFRHRNFLLNFSTLCI